MTVAVEGLGELVDLGKALGLVSSSGDFNPDWFARPDHYVGQILRDAGQRQGLFDILATFLAGQGGVETDPAGRQWIPVAGQGGVHLYVVVTAVSAGVDVGVGVRLSTVAGGTTPESHVQVLVPLLRAAGGGGLDVLLGTPDGRVGVDADVTLSGSPPPAGQPGLGGLAFQLAVGTDGSAPSLSVTLRRLQLPGQSTPNDLSLDGGSGDLAGDAIRLLVGVIQQALAGSSATGALADLLALFGLGAGGSLPSLPVADIIARGMAGWVDWLGSLVTGQDAVEAWAEHLAALVGHAAVAAPAGPDRHEVTWTLPNGMALALDVVAGPDATGVGVLEIGIRVRWAAAGSPPGRLELDATLLRISLGTVPSAIALPALAVTGRVGPEVLGGGGTPLVDVAGPPAVRVGSVRLGIGLDGARHPVLVLAADDVTIAAHQYPTLDLTNPHTLADVGGTVVSDIADELLGGLGTIGTGVRTLAGLSAPPGASVPSSDLTTIPALLADPIRAVLAYHERLLRLHPTAYPALLGVLRDLLAETAGAGPAAGDGTESSPWRLAIADGLALAAWTDGTAPIRLHLAASVERHIADLGGGCPTLAFDLTAELGSLNLDGSGGHALPSVSASLLFGARGGVPLRLGTQTAAIIADAAGVRFRWSRDGGFGASLEAPGLAAEVDGEDVPFFLPTISSSGGLEGDVPWEAFELLGGHVPRRAGHAWAEELADLLGWGRPDEPRGEGRRLSLEDVFADPIPALRAWATAVAPEALADLGRWLSLVITGSVGEGIGAGTMWGGGDRGDPLVLPFASGAPGAARMLGLALWSDLHEGTADMAVFRPGELVGWMTAPADVTTGGPSPERLAALLQVAASQSDAMADLLDGRGDVGGGLGALLARWVDTDGLVPAAAAVLPGATAHDLPGAGHLSLPQALDLSSVAGAPAGPGTVFVSGPLGVTTWPRVDADHVVDLRQAGVVPEAFDTTAVSGSDGPWLVLLPSRADAATGPGDDGAARQTARLARVVAAVAARAGSVTLVAQGAAGHAAAQVAATTSGVATLVTLGTPHGGVGVDVLESQPAADAVQLLDQLVPTFDESAPEDPSVRLGRDLLAPLLTAYHAPVPPLADLAPPASPPAIPGTVQVHCVRGRVDAVAASKALTGLIVRGLQAMYLRTGGDRPAEEQGGGAEGEDVEGAAHALAAGLVLKVNPTAAPGEIRVRAEVRLSLAGLGVDPDHPSPSRGLAVRLEIDRPGGWLAGGPDPSRPATVSRFPALRRAAFLLEIPFGGEEPAWARIVLHEAAVFGLQRSRWVIDQQDLAAGSPLLPEVQVLLGRLGSALGPLPATGMVRQLADLWRALGLVPGAATGDTVALSVDALRRLLVDPPGLLRDVDRAALAAALAGLLGANPPPAGATALSAEVDGAVVTVDLSALTVGVASAGDGIHLDAGVALTGSLEAGAAGVLNGHLGIALGPGGPSGRPVVEVDANPFAVRLRMEAAGSGLPDHVELFPTPDTAGLSRLVAAVVPAQVLWAGITFLRTLQPGAVSLVDPVLRAFGLLAGTGDGTRVAVPVGLLADPAHWLSHPTVLTDGSGRLDPAKVTALFDAAGAAIGVGGSSPGVWQLPYGVRLSVGSSAGRVRIALQLDAPPAGVDLRMAGEAALLLPGDGRGVEPDLRVLLAPPGAGAIEAGGRLALGVGPGGIEARLVVPSAGIDLQLLPTTNGLANLASAGALAQRALPLALDAVVDHAGAPIGPALGTLGDSLALRSGGHFDGGQIDALLAAPVPQLAQRLLANLHQALEAAASFLAPALPAGVTLVRQADDLVLSAGTTPAVSIRLAVPGTGGAASGVRLTASVSGVAPFAGATLDADATLDVSGLAGAHARLEIDPAAPIDMGPVALAPFAEVALGTAEATPHLAVGLAVSGTESVAGMLRFGPPLSFALEATGGMLPEVLARLLVPIAANLALGTTEFQSLLDTNVLGGATVRQLLDDVVFTGTGVFDPGALDPAQLWTRLLRLAANVAGHAPSLPIAPLTIAVTQRPDGGGTFYGIELSLTPGQRLALATGDVQVMLEVDRSWIDDADPAEGLVVELLKVTGTIPALQFGLALRGIGLRLAKASGPLIDTVLSIDSLGLHGLFAVDGTGSVTAAGGQLELAGLKVPIGAASGGTNQVAAGILRDSASGSEKPAPAFSPALALQRHGADPLKMSLRAGPGDGPWWVRIQRGFGPVYIEQVGFGVTGDGQRVIAGRVMIDGKVSFLGLTMAVDDLAVGARWPQSSADPPLYDPRAWSIDLAGLAVAADTAGLQLSGGLQRSDGNQPDYVGMLSMRFAVYGISMFAGYGVITDAQGEYTSLFLYGALRAPLGGPPAFFVTGIAAGMGVNRLLVLPADLNEFPSYPLLSALRGSVDPDPMAQLQSLRTYFPPERGAFWFAAGLSFTSFALVDCIAVVGVAIADGLDFNLLALARAALPRPEFPLAQIELALLVRFSTRDGVIWVQGQLTDNSYLLVPEIRLTGGFAYVMWFKGEHAGEFVLTLGGFHPSFHRDGYPVVPRIGYVWGISDILVIKGETYFALTSEAIMAGTRFEASLNVGPLWAYLRLSADGIVFFDPFHFDVTASAELGAGVTVDIDLGWFGHVRITISVHLQAEVEVSGPELHGKATIDLDVTSATIEFGNDNDQSTPQLDWAHFDAKYLRPGGARVLTAVPGAGQLPPSPSGDRRAPTGGTADPFLLLPEFTFTVTTVAATSAISLAGPAPALTGVEPLAIGPMKLAATTSTLAVTVTDTDGNDHGGSLGRAVLLGQFPKGVWGPNDDSKPVPTGETLTAANGLTLAAVAVIAAGTVEIDAHRVETEHRLPLPFLSEQAVRGDRAADVAAAQAVADAAPGDSDGTLAALATALARNVHGDPFTPLTAATLRPGRSAPPRLVPLTLGMEVDPGPVTAVAAPPAGSPRILDTSIHPPVVDAVFLVPSPKVLREVPRTTVGDAPDAPRVTPPTLANVGQGLDPRLPARLVLRFAPGVQVDETMAAAVPPVTARAGSGTELRRAPGTPGDVLDRIRMMTKVLQGGDGIELAAGDVAVISLPNATRDVNEDRPGLALQGELPVRVVALDSAGEPGLDETVADAGVTLPQRAARLALVAGAAQPGGDGAAGWHAGTLLVQAGWQTLIGPGCTVTSSAARTRRRTVAVAGGFVRAADAVAGFGVVSTNLPADVATVVVSLEGEGQGGAAAAGALDLGLEGASRAVDDRGVPLPPAVVLGGGRATGVYAVVPDPEGAGPQGGRITVTVASGEAVNLAAVIGTRAGAEATVDHLQRFGFDGLLGQLTSPSEATATARWVGAAGPGEGGG